MKHLILLLVLLVGAGGIALAYVSQKSSGSGGAKTVELRNSGLLADEKRWGFEFTVPPGFSRDHFVGLQIRRSRHAIDELHSDEWISVDNADEILTTAGIVISDNASTGIAAIQLLDLRDYSDSVDENHFLRIVGGIQMGGTSTQLKKSSAFLLGNSPGVFVASSAVWQGNEICLMRLETSAEGNKFVYDVMLQIRDRPIE